MAEVHQMAQFGYKSHSKYRKKTKQTTIDKATKRALDHWAVRAIVQDNLPFGVFRKKGIDFLYYLLRLKVAMPINV